MVRLVLASASTRRHALLAELGVPFDVVPAAVAEVPLAHEDPETFARRVADAKVKAVAGRVPERWILAADTVVATDGLILGKPVDRRDARRMLRRLSGRTHRVCTAVILQSPGGRRALDDLALTLVAFRPLTDGEIDAYVETGEPGDKAGAYAIQGAAGGFVVNVEGSFSNVVGLPIELVAPALRRVGLLPS